MAAPWNGPLGPFYSISIRLGYDTYMASGAKESPSHRSHPAWCFSMQGWAFRKLHPIIWSRTPGPVVPFVMCLPPLCWALLVILSMRAAGNNKIALQAGRCLQGYPTAQLPVDTWALWAHIQVFFFFSCVFISFPFSSFFRVLIFPLLPFTDAHVSIGLSPPPRVGPCDLLYVGTTTQLFSLCHSTSLRSPVCNFFHLFLHFMLPSLVILSDSCQNITSSPGNQWWRIFVIQIIRFFFFFPSPDDCHLVSVEYSANKSSCKWLNTWFSSSRNVMCNNYLLFIMHWNNLQQSQTQTHVCDSGNGVMELWGHSQIKKMIVVILTFLCSVSWQESKCRSFQVQLLAVCRNGIFHCWSIGQTCSKLVPTKVQASPTFEPITGQN